MSYADIHNYITKEPMSSFLFDFGGRQWGRRAAGSCDETFLSPLWGLFSFRNLPTAGAVGFILSPLRGYAQASTLRAAVYAHLLGSG
jgi:hypothetical protein